MHEFDIIDTYLKPLAKGAPFALGLTDDAALISCDGGKQMVLSTDTLIVDRHFPREAKPILIARRALRASLADLAAMGARPLGYLMSLSLPSGITQKWLQDFCEGLRTDQQHYGIKLWGGNIVNAPHDLSITMTVIGACAQDKAWLRSTMSPGDLLYVTGTIGDAYLGLKVLQGRLPWLNKEHQEYLVNRYYLPEPRFLKNQWVTAAIDISDGLLQDLEHLCVESNTIAQIQQDAIPLSKAAQAVLVSKEVDLLELLAGGDDYELILAVKPQKEEKLKGLTQIGYCASTLKGPTQRVRLVNQSGQRISFTKTGYEHEI
jgi:thiamine-monophosphate kinase